MLMARWSHRLKSFVFLQLPCCRVRSPPLKPAPAATLIIILKLMTSTTPVVMAQRVTPIRQPWKWHPNRRSFLADMAVRSVDAIGRADLKQSSARVLSQSVKAASAFLSLDNVFSASIQPIENRITHSYVLHNLESYSRMSESSRESSKRSESRGLEVGDIFWR